jgi:hypothetical protein
MSNKRLSQINSEEARLQLTLAIWSGLIATIGIYFVGIIVANNSKLFWIKPTCSALAMISGTSVLALRRIVEVDEYLRQNDRDILMQARQNALYQQSNLPISELKESQIYQDW